QWEQEKRWREEDRAASLAARERDLVDLQEHKGALTKAAGISYLSLVCHEDSWTFIARETFGIWRPWWVTSHTASWFMRNGTEPTPQEAYQFRMSPNLAPGRITKHKDGMQTVQLSGHNLVHILEALRA